MDSGQFQLRVFRVLVSEECVRLTFYLWGETKVNSRKFYVLSLINSLNNKRRFLMFGIRFLAGNI